MTNPYDNLNADWTQATQPHKDFSVEETFLEPTREQLEMQELLLKAGKKQLHWFQIFVYIVVLITCMAVIISFVEYHYVLAKLGEAVNNFNNELGK